MLFATSYGTDDWTREGFEKTYEGTLRFLNWTDAGKLFATECPVREAIEQTDYPQQAYEMEKTIS